MKKVTLFFIISLSLFLTTCKKEYIGDYDANYIGEWHSDTFTTSSGVEKEIYMLINGDNSEFGFMCQINCTSCACQLLAKGKARIDRKHKKLIIGDLFNTRTWMKIITPPYQNSAGKWICVIDNQSRNEPDVTMYKR